MHSEKKPMQTQCANCGQLADSANTLCSGCREERRTRNLIVAVISLSVVGLLVIILLTYFALSYNPQPTSNTATNTKTPPAPTATSTTTLAPTPTTSPGSPTPVETQLSPAELSAIIQYSEKIQPQIVAVNDEMTSVILEVKQFLKTANATKDPRDTRRVLDQFRKQLETHEQRFQQMSGEIKSIPSPTLLQQQHASLSQGVIKYQLAIQGYIRGLSAYSFNQIRSSQSELEMADREIRTAADQFQQKLNNLIKNS